MKRCCTCKEWKEEGEFSRDKKRKDGLCYQCKECHRAYRAANREEINARDRARRAANREEINARDRARRAANWKKCIALAGGVCQKCRILYDYPAMEFHHVDPALKEMQGAKAVNILNFTELDKCSLLCAICHDLYEAKFWQGTWRKRDGLGYELVEWWYTKFSLNGQTSDDPRWRKYPNGHKH